jgi:uracil-DNA glycosylase
MKKILKNDWSAVLDEQFKAPYYLRLRQFLMKEYAEGSVYPDMHDIFSALHLTSYEQTKVVILGQDPYHGANQAHGLSFSVKPGIQLPPSLLNIYKELQSDLGCRIPNHGCLEKWARQGVLLLNTVLTVRGGSPNSHKGKGWESFTDEVIRALNERKRAAVFILWGRHAQEKKALIDMNKHHVIESPHPSPFSANRGFFGSKPFSKANHVLTSWGETGIDWEISDI